MPLGLDPISNPDAYYTCTVAGQQCPGVCQVEGFKRAHEFDVKKGKGTLGATITFVGRPPAKGSIKFFLWTPLHWVQWASFRKLLKYDPTKKAVQAVDIYHPSLADIDINSVVVESIGNEEHDGHGLYTITVEMIEYFPPPPKSAVSTPSGAAASSTGGQANPPGSPAPDANADLQAQIAQLMAKAASP